MVRVFLNDIYTIFIPILTICLAKYIQCYQQFSLYTQESGSNNIIKYYKKFSPISLENNGPNSGALIQQTWNYSYLQKNYVDSEFKVKLKNKSANIGIQVTIQNMKFRRNPVSSKCNDFVKFKSDKTSSAEFCGDVSPFLNGIINLTVKNEIDVHIHIDKSLATPYHGPLNILIVFTAISKCNESNTDQIICDVDGFEENFCISKIFKGDGIMNCPAPKCNDENGCVKDMIVVKPSPSSIALSAITSLIFTMCAVGSCMWFCYKYKECIKLCATDSIPNTETSANVQMQQSSNQNQYNASSSTSENKDLPPSYDSLFGNSSRNTAQNVDSDVIV